MTNRLFTLLTLLFFTVSSASAVEPWKEKLQQQLPLLGHRNWIVVVDSAYPLQTAPGIDAYRDELKTILTKQPALELPHEQIIAKLDEAGKTFKVLVIKKPLTKPYTSVFFQLECGYWNTEAEKRLRDVMKAAE